MSVMTCIAKDMFHVYHCSRYLCTVVDSIDRKHIVHIGFNCRVTYISHTKHISVYQRPVTYALAPIRHNRP